MSTSISGDPLKPNARQDNYWVANFLKVLGMTHFSLGVWRVALTIQPVDSGCQANQELHYKLKF